MSSEAKLPIWCRPDPGTRRARLTRDDIAGAALRIADAEGIEAVSMRRVAATLGVGTMSLYHYVQTKDELLDLMTDAMMGEALVPDEELPADWRAALETIARRSLETFRRHPWAINEPLTTPGPNGMRHFDQSLAAVASLNVDFGTRFEIVLMVDEYLVGFMLRETQDEEDSQALDAGARDALAVYFESQIATGQFPQIERLVAGQETRAVIDRLMELGRSEGRCERGLRRLLDGVAIELQGATP
jgi:AcrR family transcriptional regulator